MFILCVILGNPARNEKFLASVASGKWVLHKSYFEACRQEGKFVQVCIRFM
jgi:topoisomerase (DNA) II binding protein 1